MLEETKKSDLLNKLDVLDTKAQDFRLKYKTDQRIRMEYEKLKRKEKEDSVKRKERRADYERDQKAL